MHEYGITSMLVEKIISIAKKEGAKQVLQVNIEIGEFSFLNLDQVEFCYSTLIPKTILEGSSIHLKKIKGTVQCKSCGYLGPINVIEDEDTLFYGLVSYACPDCSKMTEIVDGRAFTIRKIKFKN
ncbi:MAG: hydrogenase maturation nickel metallochaperone HypA [Candidatus Heimdallarchaeota archaeon]|nr:hydrogenase maturation nickel metallochaperone HypA [Candidatus Heimdallarchaeota archaeon]